MYPFTNKNVYLIIIYILKNKCIHLLKLLKFTETFIKI